MADSNSGGGSVPPPSNGPIGLTWNSIQAAAAKKPLVPGTSRAKVTAIQYAVAKSTGVKGVQVHFEFTGGPNAGQAAAYSIWVKDFSQETTPARVQQMLEMGKRDLELLGFESFDQIDSPPPLPAREFMVTVTVDDKNPLGKVYAFNK